jgi:hypothetical protein
VTRLAETLDCDDVKSLESILPMMDKYGLRCAPQEFQRVVNLVFHESEASVYDSVHRDMWSSLPQQFGLLASDYLLLLNTKLVNGLSARSYSFFEKMLSELPLASGNENSN